MSDLAWYPSEGQPIHVGATGGACAHRFRREGGCATCTFDHDVAPYIEDGNHRALQRGVLYVCACGATMRVGSREDK